MEVRPHSATLIKTMTFLVILVVFAGSAPAGTSIVGSKHDFSLGSSGTPYAEQFQAGNPGEEMTIDEICVFCHTPHGASTAPQTNTLLWNRTSSPPSGYTYQVYSSTSMTNAAPAGLPTGVSMMCMSCHDGVTSIAVNTLLNAPGQGNPPVTMDAFSTLPAPGTISDGAGFGVFLANIGDAPNPGNKIDLSNDHPISFAWTTGKSDLYGSPQNSALRLFNGNRIECATCHLVHNPSIEPFLAMSNANSAMCRACHIK